jgi:hypothetical protein
MLDYTVRWRNAISKPRLPSRRLLFFFLNFLFPRLRTLLRFDLDLSL